MTTTEAPKQYDREFFVKAGRKTYRQLLKKYGPKYFSKLGKRGNEVRWGKKRKAKK